MEIMDFLGFRLTKIEWKINDLELNLSGPTWNKLVFEGSQLRDAEELNNFEWCYRYLRRELCKSCWCKNSENHGTPLEIVREGDGVSPPGRTGDVDHPNFVPKTLYFHPQAAHCWFYQTKTSLRKSG